MTNDKVFGFIGTGSMGGALATAVRRAVDGNRILLANRTPQKAEALAAALNATATDNITAAKKADYLFLGVKPYLMGAVLGEIGDALTRRERPCVLVSMAAGTTIETIRLLSDYKGPIIRIMPNTPCAIGEGVVLCCSEGVDAADIETFKAAMAGAGMLDFIDEDLIDAGSAVSGCGPAFAAMFIEALADGGVACGLPRAKAQAYAAQMLAGTAALCLKSGRHPGQLKDAVCSPGGTTIQGVRALETGGFRAAVFEAVVAAYAKTLALK